MNVEPSRYDPNVQMYTHGPREPNSDHLRFLRWLVACGRLEHDAAGPPAGASVNEDAERPNPDTTNAPSLAVPQARSA